MSIAPIESVQPLALPPLSNTSLAMPAAGEPGFSEWLVNGVTNVDRALVDANQAIASFALDGTSPPHQVMMALEEARMSLQFALQVRARLVEGYQELMRMQL